MVTANVPTTRITVVQVSACHYCAEAEQTLQDLAADFDFEVVRVPVLSAHGQQLVALHRPAMAPLVLLDGVFFSAGRLPAKRLAALLTRRRESAGVLVGGDRGQ
ncbi:glutaredoxin [Cellulomonas sp. 179-A 9B4 NHS]|uniref:glutaredoxin n=1 Tax=Cellulomonas sp. 179-A 9B4 NHS TaxID=3142379 RepID=UPI00399F9AAB